MKKLLLLTCAVISMLTIGCSSDKKTGLRLDGYDEPLFLWGQTFSSVKSQVPYPLLYQDSDMLFYDGTGMINSYTYMFSDYRVLDIIGVEALLKYSEEILDFLDEKYEYLGYDGEYFYFIDEPGAMGIAVGISSVYSLLIIYISLDPALMNDVRSDTDIQEKAARGFERMNELLSNR